MATFSLKVIDRNDSTICVSSGEDFVDLVCMRAYEEGDRIVLETDCPYLAPAPYRGKRNSSLYLPLVAEVLAQVKGISEEEVRRAAWENGMRLYGMKEREKI